MKSLQVNKIITGDKLTWKNATLLLDNLAETIKVECLNWKEFPYKPRVEFRIGHSVELILLKFSVTEQAVRAVETEINGKVYLDSCVEFFLSIDGLNYYNFEFNCIGTPHVAWGAGRNDRKHLPVEKIKKMEVWSTLGDQPFETRRGMVTWDLVALIPAEVLVHDEGINFDGLSGTANFYKCGDALPEPHFVTWNPVGTPQPDYHQPDHFGRIDFE